MTNFRIIYPESRLYWVQEGYIEGRRAKVCGGARRALECLGVPEYPWSGTGWALAIPIMGAREGGGGVVPGMHPPGTHPAAPHPGYYPADRSAHYTSTVHATAGLRSTKEILGVRYALGSVRARRCCVGHCPPPYAPALRPLPGACSELNLSESQYISVYLSIPISKVFLNLRYSYI